MNFENTFLRSDLWIKNVNYSLGISVQGFARTNTVLYALFYGVRLSVIGALSAIRALADTLAHIKFSTQRTGHDCTARPTKYQYMDMVDCTSRQYVDTPHHGHGGLYRRTRHRIRHRDSTGSSKGTSIRQAPVFRHLRTLRENPWKFLFQELRIYYLELMNASVRG